MTAERAPMPLTDPSVPVEGLDHLEAFGWGEPFAGAFHGHAAVGRVPGRVVVEDRGRYLVQTAAGEVTASISGRFRFDAGDDPAAYPTVGDWVALDAHDPGNAIVHGLLPRRTAIRRLNPGRRTEAQVLAANVDVGLIVTSMNQEFEPRRIERYLAAVWESGARPAVVLSKADLADDPDAYRLQAEGVAPGVPILPISAVTGAGVDAIRALLPRGRTVVAIGSSGVGKSTLVNALAGRELMAVREVRLDDDRGRHTTRRRQLMVLPGGSLILDTPGMRELATWDGDGLAASFADIEALASACRFRDCSHRGEPGCAISVAVAEGRLDPRRLDGFRKLNREAAHLERRQDALARNEERRRWKVIHKSVRRHMKERYGD
ncbi:MAG TPA: ribosome small subunit-dependent GTPase A [Candidatus Limnocylindrales bacterium]|nr:ribosome small subunit-dependent GTPase A [Candidatus Limnocylindrales bacterium]